MSSQRMKSSGAMQKQAERASRDAEAAQAGGARSGAGCGQGITGVGTALEGCARRLGEEADASAAHGGPEGEDGRDRKRAITSIGSFAKLGNDRSVLILTLGIAACDELKGAAASGPWTAATLRFGCPRSRLCGALWVHMSAILDGIPLPRAHSVGLTRGRKRRAGNRRCIACTALVVSAQGGVST